MPIAVTLSRKVFGKLMAEYEILDLEISPRPHADNRLGCDQSEYLDHAIQIIDP